MRGMGDESAVGPAGSPSAALEVPATRRRDASSHYEGRGLGTRVWRATRCPFGDDLCDRGPEVDFLGAQTDRPTRHTALQVGSRAWVTRRLELIRQVQHRLDTSLWT
jgi:hypothetical protein